MVNDLSKVILLIRTHRSPPATCRRAEPGGRDTMSGRSSEAFGRFTV